MSFNNFRTPVVKLDATPSTNDFLKELAAQNELENFTAVTAKSQTNGRGQMGATWQAEAGKNLTMSVFVRNAVQSYGQLPDLSIAVAMSVFDVFAPKVPKASVKWPNDIMSDNFKIGGILIENSLASDEIRSIIGIGINVNQTDFAGLPKASSIKVVSGLEYDVDAFAVELIDSLQLRIKGLSQSREQLWTEYQSVLFRKGVPMAFEDQQKRRFMGIITGVAQDGRIEVRLEDDSLQLFGIREIAMLY